MTLKEFMKQNRLYLDGGMGTLLQEAGLQAGELPERWNLTHPEVVTGLHRRYYDAGSHVVTANTFGANSLKYSAEELEEIIKAALGNVRSAAAASDSSQPKWVALDIGPTGKLLEPYGELSFEQAVSVFAQTVRLGVRYGADLILIETMNDCYETKAALLAAKENSDLPVFVSNAYEKNGRLMTGATPSAMVAMLEGMGADAIGVNCSFGPEALAPIVEEYLSLASVPVLFQPNAGLPRTENGKTVYDIDPLTFAAQVAPLVQKGVSVVGGCCGTTPEHIARLVEETGSLPFLPVEPKERWVVSSYTHAVEIGKTPLLIGERINPTGKKRFKEALRAGDMDYILDEGLEQKDKGVHILDVNVGLPEIDEVSFLRDAVCELQSVIQLPLQIDTADPAAMEAALRRYNGKAMINSVNGKQESMDSVFPLAKKYGGLVVALTLDESGIPSTAEGRLAIAEKILNRALEFGLRKCDLIFDPLTMAISADATSGVETLRAVELIRQKLGCPVSLGVSNVSFGLPHREILNSHFFTMALNRGLSCAIMNPYSEDMMQSYKAYLALSGQDENFGGYIAFAESLPEKKAMEKSGGSQVAEEEGSPLAQAIQKGLKEQAAELTAQALSAMPPLEIVQKEIIPALNRVGEGFEKKKIYLPSLLMSAEAAKVAFEKIKEAMPSDSSEKGAAVVLATVKGDIHDIGKNIVKLLLENYGFDVTDLGRDVPPEQVVEAVCRLKAPLVGLSALMTTTLPAMEETVRLLREKTPCCKIVVGGAVLTKEFSERIGAHQYARDAMETVRYAQSVVDND